MIIDGKKIAAEIISQLKNKRAPEKALVAVLVGTDESSVRFVRKKSELAAQLGIKFETYYLPNSVSEEMLETEVRKISDREEVGGMIVQLPLPANINRQKILDSIDEKKDIDCLTTGNLKKFYSGDFKLVSPTVGALKSILQSLNLLDLKNKQVAVVGAGVLVGKPVTAWLKHQGANVSVIDQNTEPKERAKSLKQAEVIISGVGKANLITGNDISPNSIIIDFGYPPDIEAESVSKIAAHYTPTPGGTGPIVVAELFKNFYQLNS